MSPKKDFCSMYSLVLCCRSSKLPSTWPTYVCSLVRIVSPVLFDLDTFKIIQYNYRKYKSQGQSAPKKYLFAMYSLVLCCRSSKLPSTWTTYVCSLVSIVSSVLFDLDTFKSIHFKYRKQNSPVNVPQKIFNLILKAYHWSAQEL